MDRILAVDKNTAVHEEQTKEWAKYGIGTQRADTMSDAISRIVKDEKYLLIVINEDTIPNFTEQLQIARDAADSPIFVVTSSYTIDKKIKAMNLGADAYEPFTSYTKQNVLLALETLNAQNRWAKRPQKQVDILIGGDIVLSQRRRKVFVKDIGVSLAKKEFDILYYLMANSGCVVKHKQLVQEIWGEDYGEKDADVLWRTINRIRAKLSVICTNAERIRIERGVGYAFDP